MHPFDVFLIICACFFLSSEIEVEIVTVIEV